MSIKESLGNHGVPLSPRPSDVLRQKKPLKDFAYDEFQTEPVVLSLKLTLAVLRSLMAILSMRRLRISSLSRKWKFQWSFSIATCQQFDYERLGSIFRRSRRPSIRTDVRSIHRFIFNPAAYQRVFVTLQAHPRGSRTGNAEVNRPRFRQVRDALLPRLLSGELRVPVDGASVSDVEKPQNELLVLKPYGFSAIGIRRSSGIQRVL